MNKIVQSARTLRGAVLTAALVAAGAAHAAADVTVIDSAKTDMLAFLAAMLLMAVAVWGAKKVYGLFSR